MTSATSRFLLVGVSRGERGLYVSLSEIRSEIAMVARSHGWDISKIQMTGLGPSEANLSPDAQLTVFHPAEIEFGVTTQAMIAAVEQHRPQRVVVDSLSELRLIA